MPWPSANIYFDTFWITASWQLPINGIAGYWYCQWSYCTSSRLLCLIACYHGPPPSSSLLLEPVYWGVSFPSLSTNTNEQQDTCNQTLSDCGVCSFILSQTLSPLTCWHPALFLATTTASEASLLAGSIPPILIQPGDIVLFTWPCVTRAVRRTIYGVRPYRYGWGTVTEQPDP